jgi:hypothetical protein
MDDIPLSEGVEFKWKREGSLARWEDLKSLVVFDIPSAERAWELARTILRYWSAEEVRWNWLGLNQGHYMNRRQLHE